MDIDYLDLLYCAWNRMVKILFQPFNFMNWLILSFVTWLAYLFEKGGGVNFPDFNFSKTNPGKVNTIKKSFENVPDNITPAYVFDKIREFLGPEAIVIITLITLVILFGIIIGFALVWVKSRAEFMLVDNLAYTKYEIKKPWKNFAHLGNSVFWWRVGLGIFSFITFMALGILAVVVAIPIVKSFINKTTPSTGFIICLAVIGIVVVSLTVLLMLVNFYLKHIIIPLMYQKQIFVIEAWKLFFSLLRRNFPAFLIYIIMVIIVNILSGIATIVFTLATCCIAMILLAIPFVWAFLLLPIFIYHRLLGLEFLARLDQEYNVFAHEYECYEQQEVESY